MSVKKINCHAPTFQGNSVCACFILSLIYAFAILILLLPALLGSEKAKCKIKQYQFRINNCVKGNSDPNIDLLPALLKVYSIQFNFEGSKAIDLKDHISNSYVHTTPEWDENGRDEPAAYIRNTHPHIKVIFSKLGDLGIDTFTVGANGTLGGVTPQEITLVFNSSGLTDQIEFELVSPLPNAIGKHRVSFEWYAINGDNVREIIGNSSHVICTTWRNLNPNPAEGLYEWVYKEPMLWTSEWATLKNNEKDICDAIIQNLHLSGLQYGLYNWTVRDMLREGGGMCGGWYQMFQHLAHCQGVFVHRRFYGLQWLEFPAKNFPNNEVNWCAIVIKSGGLNQPTPLVESSEWYDDDTDYPITPTTSIITRIEQRWRFWSAGDGHCINFLIYDGKLYLYDPSFGTGPIEITPFTGSESPLPPKDSTALGGTELSSFKLNYLNSAIDYIMGELYDGNGNFYDTYDYDTYTIINGMTVKTSIIQDIVDFPDGEEREGITFYWGP